MPALPFQQVDVFTAVPFKGNPVAVILDADGLATDQMQAIANWTNLSETTFVCRPTHPEADYRLRIFTPRNELPFAGHPTIGSAHAVLRHGLTPRTPGRLIQECGKGLVTLRAEADRIDLQLPTTQQSEPSREAIAAAAKSLGISSDHVRHARLIDVGAIWLTIELPTADAVLALRPDMAAVAALGPPGLTGITVVGRHAPGSPADYEVRSFAPAHGIPEDPVCGSGNGCVAALLRATGTPPAAYVAAQGQYLGRAGRVQVEYADHAIWLGGQAVTCVEGAITV